jgi:YspA, cpYpsA-related SLOG family
MRVLVTGSRDLTDPAAVHDALNEIWADPDRNVRELLVVVHGDNPAGADYYAHRWCAARRDLLAGVREERHPADWATHGKAAGPNRNQKMVDLGADLCLAFLQPGAANTGTTDCVRRARAAGIPVTTHGQER